MPWRYSGSETSRAGLLRAEKWACFCVCSDTQTAPLKFYSKNVPKQKKCSGTFSFLLREILISLATSHLRPGGTRRRIQALQDLRRLGRDMPSPTGCPYGKTGAQSPADMKKGLTALPVSPCFLWSQLRDLNSWPADYESAALPTELSWREGNNASNQAACQEKKYVFLYCPFFSLR